MDQLAIDQLAIDQLASDQLMNWQLTDWQDGKGWQSTGTGSELGTCTWCLVGTVADLYGSASPSVSVSFSV